LGELRVSCGVSSDFAPAQWRYLDQYLAPFAAADDAAFRVVACVDDDRFAAVARHLERLRADAVIEPLRGVTYERFRVGPIDWYRLLGDSVNGDPSDHLIASAPDHLWLFMHSRTSWPERHLLRLLREAMVRRHEDVGWIALHGAAVRVDGGAVLVCGPDGAGKTTFATALLQLQDAAWLSSDIVLIHVPDAHVLCVPQAVRAGAGLVNAVPRLRDYVHSGELTRLRQPTTGADAHAAMTFASRTKYEFGALEYAHVFGAGLAASAPLMLTLLPRLEPGFAPWHDDDHDADQRLAGECLTPNDPRRVPWIVERRTPVAGLAGHAEEGLQAIRKFPRLAGSAGVQSDLAHVVRRVAAIADRQKSVPEVSY